MFLKEEHKNAICEAMIKSAKEQMEKIGIKKEEMEDSIVKNYISHYAEEEADNFVYALNQIIANQI